MKTKFSKISRFILISSLLLSACGLLPSGAAPASAPGEAPAEDSPAEIEHQTIPVDLPAENKSKVGDYDSSQHSKSAPGGDRFSRGEYERPFTADTMEEYFPYLDIRYALILEDDIWVFGVIAVGKAAENNSLPGNYALQFDTNVDGRGDWLVMVSNPSSTDWTTDGVQVWQDANKDIGGNAPVLADEHPLPGDGFETNVFDSGNGADPDMAWARISPDDPAVLQIALKRSVINDNDYMVSMWTGSGSLSPALFDFNDQMTHEQAGAADPGLEIFYPIKGLSELDNTCSMAIGFQPNGNEPGLCKAPPPCGC